MKKNSKNARRSTLRQKILGEAPTPNSSVSVIGEGNSIVYHDQKSKSLLPPLSLPTGRRHKNLDATDRNLRPAVSGKVYHITDLALNGTR